MNRDIDKSIQKYKKYIKKNNRYDLFSKEIDQIMTRTHGEPFYTLSYGYMHGFMVGYRAALRDMKKREGAK